MYIFKQTVFLSK